MEATFIRGRLESAGIPVQASGESLAGLYGLTLGDLARVKLFVPEQRLTEARRLLAEAGADGAHRRDPGARRHRADDAGH